MTKRHLPKLRQVLIVAGKKMMRIIFWGFFFSLRMFFCYSLWYDLTHNRLLSLFVGFWLACGTDFLFTEFF